MYNIFLAIAFGISGKALDSALCLWEEVIERILLEAYDMLFQQATNFISYLF